MNYTQYVAFAQFLFNTNNICLLDFFAVGVKVEKPKKMPEHRKIATKTPKVKSSAVKRTENTDNVSLASSDGRLSISKQMSIVVKYLTLVTTKEQVASRIISFMK